MEIGLFQLENLFQNPNTFLFFDVREERQSVHPAVDKLVGNGKAMKTEQVLEYVDKERVNRELPIVLMCEQGKNSSKLGNLLEEKGFNQIYVVAGGVKGLLSEL